MVGTLSVVDEDAGDSHSYSVDDTRFEVVGTTLKLKAGESLDYETDSPLSVTVTVTDTGGLTYTEAFALTVVDVNEAPTDIGLTASTVTENAAGATVGTLSVVDEDAGDSHTYSVDDTRFEVVGTTLKLKAGESLDYETDSPLSVTVTVTDTGGLTYTEAFALTVVDVNEAPTDIGLTASTVTENAAGATVGTLSVVDEDAGDSHTYSVDDTRFEVVGTTLKLKAGESLDYETDSPLSVTVTVTDTGGLTYTEAFALTVVDVNEAPTDIGLTASTVTENAAGATVGTLSVVDEDAGDSHTYSVDDTRFEVVGTTLKLKAGESLDYETDSPLSVTVTVTDTGGLTYTEAFALTVVDVNEAPTDIGLTASTVTENAAGATVGTLSVVDEDAGDSHTYSVDDTRFEVVGTTLKLKAGESLDYETDSPLSVTVTVTDTGGLTYTEAFALTVVDVNEAPTGIGLTASTVTENAAGATVGTLSVVDEDAGDSHTYSVDDTRFEVVGTTLTLKAGESLDYETDSPLSVTVTVTDTGGLTYTEAFALTVVDVNEAPTDIGLT